GRRARRRGRADVLAGRSGAVADPVGRAPDAGRGGERARSPRAGISDLSREDARRVVAVLDLFRARHAALGADADARAAAGGDRRDSEDGLGGGRYPYDVNTALVPAALDAAAKLFPLVCDCRDRAEAAHALAQTWHDKAPGLFRVELADAQALEDAYAKEQG